MVQETYLPLSFFLFMENYFFRMDLMGSLSQNALNGSLYNFLIYLEVNRGTNRQKRGDKTFKAPDYVNNSFQY
jgi:hypothetical protein